MEHPGAILYLASSLLLDESATQNQLLGRASPHCARTAHMWFGDLVTMEWVDDVWMKEVFANVMAAKIANPTFPDIDHDLRFLMAHIRVRTELTARRGRTRFVNRSTTSTRRERCMDRSSIRRRRSS